MAPPTITIMSNHHLHAFNIVNTNPFHFITLSLFFLPLAFFIHLHFTSCITLQNILTFKILTTLVTVIISTVIGTSLTIYTTHQAILRKPITFTSIFKSLSHSFIPLLTTLTAATIRPTLSLSFMLRFHLSDFTNSFLIALNTLVHLVIWGLAPAIAVLERKSFFESLGLSKRRSENFLFGLLGNVCITGGLIGISFWTVFDWMTYEGPVSSWLVFVQVSVRYAWLSMMLVYYFVVVTLLYVRVKVVSDGGRVVVRSVAEDLMFLKKGAFSYTMLCFRFVLVLSLVIDVVVNFMLRFI